MENKQVPPKTLVAVIAAVIREESEAMAQAIVNQVKGRDVEYQQLVSDYILKTKEYSKTVNFTDKCNQALEQFRDIEKFNKLKIEVRTIFEFNPNVGKIIPERVNEFDMSFEIDELDTTASYNRNKYVYASGGNFDAVVTELKNKYEKEILGVVPVDVVVE